jgi:hypothetical protein
MGFFKVANCDLKAGQRSTQEVLALIHDSALREIVQKLRPLLEPPPQPPKPEIGFHIKENGPPYRVKKLNRSVHNRPH